MSPMVTLQSKTDNFQFDALHLQAKASRKAGVIVLSEIFGIDQYIRADATRWSERGFEVLAPSLFDREKRGFVGSRDEAGLQEAFQLFHNTGFETPLGDIQACIDFLAPRGAVFLVGYCYGGSLAWLASSRLTGLSAVSSYYGGSIGDFLDLAPACPLICHFGEKDAHLPSRTLADRLEGAYPELPVYLYPNSGHGFNNDGISESDPEDAALARSRTLNLFDAAGVN